MKTFLYSLALVAVLGIVVFNVTVSFSSSGSPLSLLGLIGVPLVINGFAQAFASQTRGFIKPPYAFEGIEPFDYVKNGPYFT